MAQCPICGREKEGYPFQTLEVQTLHVRDFTGEKRVQALGNFQDWTVCEDCARRWLEESLAPGKRLTRTCLPFALVLLAGTLWTLLVQGDVFALRLLGPAAIFCGLAGVASSTRQLLTRSRELRALPREEALRRAAWESLLSAAPKKNGDNDLTYIPVDDETRRLDQRQLALRHDLLPAIAAQALERMAQDKGD